MDMIVAWRDRVSSGEALEDPTEHAQREDAEVNFNRKLDVWDSVSLRADPHYRQKIDRFKSTNAASRPP